MHTRPQLNLSDFFIALLLSVSFVGCGPGCPCPDGGKLEGAGAANGGRKWCVNKNDAGKMVRSGPYDEWFEPGNKKESGFYKNDMRDGVWQAWYKNGKRRYEGTWKDGVPDGKWTYWYPNGNLQRQGYRKNGINSDLWQVWNSDGTLREKVYLTDAKKDGVWERYYPNGKLESKGNCVQDMRVGQWSWWDESGRLKKKRTYPTPKKVAATLTSKPLQKTPPPKGQNVLLIVVDALRADGLTPYGYSKPTSPAIAELAEEGIVFENAHSSSPWTAPSFASILTGVSPTVHQMGTRLFKSDTDVDDSEVATVGKMRITRLSPNIPTIAQLLKPIELKTGAIVNNGFLHKDTGLGQGFDFYDLVIPYGKGQKRANGFSGPREATEVTDTAMRWIFAQNDSPFFMMVHYFDPHVAYDAPEKYREQFATFDTPRFAERFSQVTPVRNGTMKVDKMEQLQIRALYDAEVRYTDDEIGRLLKRMEQRGLLDNTWVIFTADHGEEIFDHGGIDHGHRYEEEVVRIPFIIRAPGGKWNAGVRLSDSIGQVDVLPTILDIFGQTPPPISEGTSLLSLILNPPPARPAYMEFNLYWGEQFAWYDGKRYKLVYPLDGKAKPFVYDLQADPFEKEKLDTSHPMYRKLYSVATTYRTALQQKAENFKDGEQAVPLSKDVEESLRALGYIDG
ncbi:MAG: sulfatase-like hydrolase/transferase [Deltaproteobacteria bacterium]|nr:sulfatase-like hydrolase/transferase [Deltaproteobacteria bacterium]MBN2672445.1 sulfatase-like hydrolase/transferase [Deltaproteobacteria bacterium]